MDNEKNNGQNIEPDVSGSVDTDVTGGIYSDILSSYSTDITEPDKDYSRADDVISTESILYQPDAKADDERKINESTVNESTDDGSTVNKIIDNEDAAAVKTDDTPAENKEQTEVPTSYYSASQEATYDPTRGINNNYADGSENSAYGSGYTYSTNYVHEEDNRGSSTLGVVSLVLGIISIVCCACGCTGIVFGVPAIICGIIHLVKKNRSGGLGIAGIICGSIGLIIGVVIIIFAIIFGSGDIYDDLDSYMNDLINEYDDDYDYSYNYDDNDYNFYDDSESDIYDSELNDMYESYIYGQWVIEDGSGSVSYVFNSDGSWGFYKDYNDMSDNYYAGSSAGIVKGQEAMDLFESNVDEYSYDELHIDVNRLFCLQLNVDTFFSDGEDKSDEYDGNSSINIAMLMYSDEDATLINMSTGDQYSVSKINLYDTY